jgi:YD repeat-containing protein
LWGLDISGGVRLANPKPEARNPKAIRNPQAETTTLAWNLLSRLPCRTAAGQPARLNGHRSSNGDCALRISDFGLRVSVFGFRPARPCSLKTRNF